MFANLLKLMLLLFTLPCMAQQYDFDYVQEYRLEIFGENSRDVTFFKFFNSKNPAYSLGVSIIQDKVFMSLNLDNGDCYYDSILKDDFFVYAISLKCPRKGKGENYPNRKPAEFKPFQITDTLIEGKKYNRILLEPIKNKKRKDSKALAGVYLLDNSYNFEITVSDPASLLSFYKKQGIDIPSGIIKEFYATDAVGKLTEKLSLTQCVPVQKVIFLDTNCK